MTSKTIALTGDEARVDYGGGTNVWLRNDGTDAIYASTSPGITAGADGTASIPAGQAMRIDGTCGTVYLLGTGSVQLVGSDYTACPFKTSAQSGGSGADDVARAAIEAHAGNADIHVTADEKANWLKWIPRDIDIIGDSTFESPYESYINDTEAVDLGIVTQNNGSYWHILYLRALPGMGYGLQIAMPLNKEAGMPCYRKSEGAVWGNWRNFADGGNAETLDGKHASDFAQYCDDIADCNNAISLGTYNAVPSTINTPASSFWLIAVEIGAEGNFIKQTATLMDSTHATTKEIYHREYVNDGWSPWGKISDGGNADTLDGKHADDFKIFSFIDNGAGVTCIEAAQDTNNLVRLQIQTNMEIARLFKTTDGGASWTELPLGAATNIGAYTEEKLVALEARIAALEGGN